MRKKIWVETNDPRYKKAGFWRKVKVSDKPQKTTHAKVASNLMPPQLGSSNQSTLERPPNLELLKQGASEAKILIGQVKPFLGELPRIEDAQLAMPDLSDLNPKLANSIASDIKTLYESMPKTDQQTAFEQLYLYNAATGGRRLPEPDQNSYTRVTFDFKTIPDLAIYDPQKGLFSSLFISLHNHPDSGSFSPLDYKIMAGGWFNKDGLFVSAQEDRGIVVDAYGNSFVHKNQPNYLNSLEGKTLNRQQNPLEANAKIKEIAQNHTKNIDHEYLKLLDTIRSYKLLIASEREKDLLSISLFKILAMGIRYEKETALYRTEKKGASFDPDLKRVVDTSRFIAAQLIGINLQAKGIIDFNYYLNPAYQNIDQGLTRFKEYIMNNKENNQRQDSGEETELQTSPVYIFDDGDDPFGIQAIGKIVMEIADSIELSTARKDSRKKVWVDTKDPKYKKGGYWRRVDISNKSEKGANRATVKSLDKDSENIIERRKQEVRIQRDKENKGEALFLKSQVQRAFSVADLSVENNTQLSLPNMNELYPDSATRKVLMGKIAEYYLGMPKESNQLSPENFFSVTSTGGRVGQETKGELTTVQFAAKNFPDYLSKDSYGSDQEMKERVIERTLFDFKYNTFTHPPVVTLHNHPIATPFSGFDHMNPFLMLYEYDTKGELAGVDVTKEIPTHLYSAEQESYMVVDNFGNTYHGKPTNRFRSFVLPEKDRFPVADLTSDKDVQFVENTVRSFVSAQKSQKVVSYYYGEYERSFATKLLTSAKLEDTDFEQLTLSSKVALKAINFFRDNQMYYDDDEIKKNNGKLPSKEIADIMQLGCFFEQHLQNAYLDEADIVKYKPTLTPFHTKLVRQIQELETIARKKGKSATALSGFYLDSTNSTSAFIMDTPEKRPDSIVINLDEQNALIEKYGKMSFVEALAEISIDAEKGIYLFGRGLINDRPGSAEDWKKLADLRPDLPERGVTSEDIADAVRQTKAYRAGVRDVELGLIPNLLSPERVEQIFGNKDDL